MAQQPQKTAGSASQVERLVMQSYKITGVETMITGWGLRFTGFFLDGIVGDVDPFVDGVFMADELKQFLDDEGNVLDGMSSAFIEAELEWARNQIGKTFNCENLSFKAFATNGKVSISA